MRILIIIVSMALLCALPAQAVEPYPPQEQIDAAYENAKRLRPSKVYKLFKDKTWLWEEGSAHFSKRLRFLAYTDKTGNENYAVGYWRPTLFGRLCFTAIWTGLEYKVVKRNCFRLREAEGVIYMAAKDGDPFILQSNIPIEYEEYQKILDGNIRADDFNRTKNRVRQLRK